MINYLWASPHKPQSGQLKMLDGAVYFLEEVHPELFDKICNMTFDTNIIKLADELLAYCLNNNYQVLVQPGGSPAFQATLGLLKAENNINAMKLGICWSFSKRVSEDIPQDDGTIKKVAIFKHEGFVYL